jgi:peptide/nickel transport system substrate-binding protein
MENRFGVKDFFLFLLLGFVIVLVLLAMNQFDRQWKTVQETNTELRNLTGDVARIKQRLDEGGAVTTQSSTSFNKNWTGLERVVKAYSAPDYAEGDNLVLDEYSQPDKLTPLINQDTTSQIIQGFVMDGLISRDPDTFEFIPALAESWHVSPDLLTIDFTLKQGIVFSDGTPVTSDDVVFTFEMAKNPQIEAPGIQSLMDKIERVEKIDDLHVRFHMSAPYFKSLETTGAAGMGIMSKAFYSKYSVKDYNESVGLLIGTGPYRLADPTSWRPEPGKPIEFVRNERYWGPRPSFNKIILRVIENPTARETAFINGDLDGYCGNDAGPSPEQYKDMLANKELVARTQHFAIDNPTVGWYYIGWNEKVGRDGPPSKFADPRVRKALSMLTDRKKMVDTILYGYGTISTGPFHHMLDQADPNLQPLPFDPDAAQKLLAEAGYVKRDGVLYGPDGRPFTFKLSYPTSSDIRRRCMPLIHDSMALAGIQVEPDAQQFSNFVKKQNDRDYEAVLSAWGGVLDNDLYQIFDSVFIAGTGDDYIQYKNPELDATIEKARITLDHAERTALWRKCDDIIYQDQPYSFLYSAQEMDFVDSRIRGVTATKAGINSFQEWYVPKALQKYTQ